MLIDTHAHLEMREFNDDREDVIKRAREAGVEYIVTIGTTLESSRDAVLLAEKYDSIYAAIGIHPHEAKLGAEEHFQKLDELARHPRVIAWGEIGLDYFYDHSPRETQKQVLIRQVEIACEVKLPIVIHCRDAYPQLLELLKQEAPPPRAAASAGRGFLARRRCAQRTGVGGP